MKRFLFLAALALATVWARADELLQVIPQQVAAGDNGGDHFTVAMKNSDNVYLALQFDLYLPEGVEIVDESKTQIRLSGDRFTIVDGACESHGTRVTRRDGFYRVQIYGKNGNAVIAGHAGNLCDVFYTAESDISGILPARVKNVVLGVSGTVGVKPVPNVSFLYTDDVDWSAVTSVDLAVDDCITTKEVAEAARELMTNPNAVIHVNEGSDADGVHNVMMGDVTYVNSGMELSAGWNWMSYNVMAETTPEPMELIGAIASDVERFLDQEAEIVNDPKYGLVGNMRGIDPTKGYKIKLSKPATISMEGQAHPAATTEVELKRGWNWVGYLPTVPMGVNDALAGLDAQTDDQIRGLMGFAAFNGSQWMGDLEELTPNSGYIIYSGAATSFYYPAEAQASAAPAQSKPRNAGSTDAPWTVDVHKYPDVATVIASLDTDKPEAYTVGAFAGCECRGIGKSVGDCVFITIHGENSDREITFRAIDTTGHEFDIAETIQFTDNMVGTCSAPLAMHIVGDATGIEDVRQAGTTGAADGIYTAGGVKVDKPVQPGIYISQGRKIVITK